MQLHKQPEKNSGLQLTAYPTKLWSNWCWELISYMFICFPAISKVDYKVSSKPLFANLKILGVFSIHSLQVSSFMYLYHNDALPISFTQIFQTGNQIHQYSTRYSNFYRPHTCRTNIKKISILFQGPRIWNSLPNNIKNIIYSSVWSNHF